MKFLELRSIEAKDTGVHYRRQYRATAVFHTQENDKLEQPVRFTVEHTAHGIPEISVELPQDVESKVASAKNKIEEQVLRMARENRLP